MAADEVKSSPATEPRATKPEKPDEEAYKAALAKAESEHAAVIEKLVCQWHSRCRKNFPCRTLRSGVSFTQRYKCE